MANIFTNFFDNLNKKAIADNNATNIDPNNLAGVNYQQQAVGTPYTGKTMADRANETRKGTTEQSKKNVIKNAEEKVNNSKYTNDDVNSVITYSNNKGETKTGTDFYKEYDNYAKTVKTAVSQIENINNNYLRGDYGEDNDGYNRYLQDFNLAKTNVDNLISQEDYYKGFTPNWTDINSQIANNENRIKEIGNQTIGNQDIEQVAKLTEERIKLSKQNEELKALADKQQDIQLEMGYKQAKEEGDEEALLEYSRGIIAKDFNVAERTALKLLTKPMKVLAGALQTIDAVADFASSNVARAELAIEGKISDKTYEQLVEEARPAIDYSKSGLASELNSMISQMDTYANLGASTIESLASDLASNVISMYGGLNILGSMYAPVSAMTNGSQRYFELRNNGVDPNTAMANSASLALAQYYLTRYPLKEQQSLYATMNKAGLTKATLNALLKASGIVALDTTIANAGVYGIDWLNNAVIEYLGVDTGLEYSAGDMFKNAMNDMMTTYITLVGGGVVSGIQGGQVQGTREDGTELPLLTYKTPEEYPINSMKEYNQIKADIELMKQITPSSEEEANAINNAIASANKGLQNYNNTSVLGDAVKLTTDEPTITTLGEIEQTAVEALTPSAQELLENHIKNMEVANAIDEIKGQRIIQDLTSDGTFTAIQANGKNKEVPITDFSKAVDYVLSGDYERLFPSRDVLLSDTTPKIFLDNVEGAKNKPILIDTSHIKDAIYDYAKKGHLLTKEDLKKVPSLIKDPIAIIKNNDHNSYNLLLKINIKGNNKAIIAIKLDEHSNYYDARIQTNRASTIFDIYDNEKYINSTVKDKDIIYPKGITKKELIELADMEYPYQERPEFTNNITLNDSNIKSAKKIINNFNDINNIAENNAELIESTELGERARAVDIKVNTNVKGQDKWTGLQNMSVDYENIKDEDISKLFKKINGASTKQQRKAITDTVLSIDTHINWKKLSIDFEDIVFSDNEIVSGEYNADKMLMRIGESYNHTVPHEGGHYIDHLWGSELVKDDYYGRVFLTDLYTYNGVRAMTGPVGNFISHFRDFVQELTTRLEDMYINESDDDYNYLTNEGEVFARFIDYFVNWTKATVDGRIPVNKEFHTADAEKFIKLLQEKSALNPLLEKNAVKENKPQVDNQGNKINQNMADFLSTSIGDRENPTDPNSPHMVWLHGSPNATFTVMNPSENGGPETNAIYLTNSSRGASSYSGKEETVDPYNLPKPVKTFKEAEDYLNKHDVTLFKYKGNYFVKMDSYGDELFIRNPYDIEEYMDARDSLEQFVEGDDGNFYNWLDDEVSDRGLETFDALKIGNKNDLINTINNYAFNRGIYELYAKSENPLIVDAKGANWNELLPPESIKDNSVKTNYGTISPEEYIELGGQYFTTRDYEKYALDNGYDSIRYLNIVDTGQFGSKDTGPQDILVVFKPDQVKAIENQKPTTNPDIRYNKDLDILSENIVKPKNVNVRTAEVVERFEEEVRKDIKEWLPFYEPIRQKYAMLDQVTFDDALAEIFITGTIRQETKDRLAQSIIKNDFEGVYSGNSLTGVVNQYINDVEEYLRHYSYYRANHNILNSKGHQKVTAMNSFDGTYFSDEWDNLTESQLDEKIADIKDKPIEKKWGENNGKDLAKEILDNGTDKVSPRKTLEQNFDAVAGIGTPLREDLTEIEIDRANAQAREVQLKRNAQKVLDDIYNKYGIRGKTEESKYMQYYLEGHTEKYKNIKLNTQEAINEFKAHPWEEYTLEDLKKDRPNDWENIKKAGDEMKKAYLDFYNDLNQEQISAYGDIEGEAKYKVTKLREKLNIEYNTMQSLLDELSKKSTPQLQSAYINAMRNYNRFVEQYNDLVGRVEKGDETRRQLTKLRQNYAHHFQDQNFIQRISNALKGGSSTPTYLAGITEDAKPLTRFAGALMGQEGGAYTPDAITGFALYANQVSPVIAYNPFIGKIRGLVKDLQAEAKGNNMSKFTTYLSDYANMLAGKRGKWDRALDTEADSKFVNVLRTLNNQTKKAVLQLNPRSSLVQFGNVPAGMGILEEKGGKEFVQDVAKGLEDYRNSFNDPSAPQNQSAFLGLRYFEMDTREKSITASYKNATNYMMQALDKVGTEIIWNSAYEQAIRKGEPNPILYADDIARRSVSGRSLGEVPVTQSQEIIKFLFPFTNETNNTWQNFKSQVKGHKLGAIITTQVATFFFNMIVKLLGVRDDQVLPEFITPLIDFTEKLPAEWAESENKIETVGSYIKNVLGGELAQVISMVPGGAQALNLAMDSDTIEKIFGGYNPSRYGITNIALQGIGDIVKDVIGGESVGQTIKDVAIDLIENYAPAGKQGVKTGEGLYNMFNPVVTNDKGQIKYINDTGNIFNWIESTLYGPYATKEAQAYYDNPHPWGEKKSNIFTALQEVGNNVKEAQNKLNDLYTDSYVSTEDSQEFINMLKENGMFEGYYNYVADQYAQYEGDKDEDKFFASYGLTKTALKKETAYDDYFANYELTPDQQESFKEALELEGKTGDNGRKVSNSEGLAQRKQMEEDGTWESYYKWVMESNHDYKKDGFTKTVMEYDPEEFQKAYTKVFGN